MNTPTIQIAGHTIGGHAPCFIIAEVGQAHGGSFDAACAYIDAVADAGVDAIKFQTHLAACESSLDEPFRVAMAGGDRSRYDYWKRMEFTEPQWRELAEKTRARGLVFLSSAFSVEAVALLSRIGMPAWKIGSGEFRSFELIEAIQARHEPVLLSTGMSRYSEIGTMIDIMRGVNLPHALLQCTSKYPTAFEDVGLNVIHELRTRFNCPVGLSDHSGTPYPGMAAMAQGADLLEIHVVLDRAHGGPDTPASLLPTEIRELSKARDAFSVMRTCPVDKDGMAERLENMRGLFSKSVAPARDLPAGSRLTEDLLVPRKPGTGIPYGERNKLVGRRLKRDVSPLNLLTWKDIDE